MKKIVFILTILMYLAGISSAAFADSTSSSVYIGSDLDQNGITQCTELLGNSKYKFFNAATSTNLLKSQDTTSLDCISFTPSQSITVKILKDNNKDKNNGMDSLGMLDFLLSLGIYNANVQVVNTNYEGSLAQIVQAYQDSGNKFDTKRVDNFSKQLDLYFSLENQIKDTAKTSRIFFNLEKGAMSDPDTGTPTHSIVDTALSRENVHVTDEMKGKLYTWEYNYIVGGNNWQGFFRDITLASSTTNGDVSVGYKQLGSAPTPDSTSTNGNKIGAFAVFAIAFVFIGTIVYKLNKRNKNSDNHISRV